MGDDGKPEGPGFDDGTRTERRRSGRVERAARPRMRDLAGRPAAAWRALAEADVAVSQETLSGIVDGVSPRGDVLTVAELAGVMAAKRTSELIPLSHSVPLTDLLVKAVPDRAGGTVRITVETAAIAQSGVEMEALTGAAVAALTLYDMIRETDLGASIRGVRLLSRSGGEGEAWERPVQPAESGPAYGRKPPRGARVAGRISPAPRPGNRSRGPARRIDR